jgi:hypothetical protein
LADHNQVVLLVALEMDVLKEAEAPADAKMLATAAESYRARAKVLRQMGRIEAAQADEQRAAKFDSQAQQTATAPKAKNAGSQIEILARQIEELRKELDDTHRKLLEATAPSRQAGYGPAAPGSPGHLQLINAWLAPVTIVVDETRYSLQAGEARMVDHRAGPFTYEVPGIQQIITRTVEPGRTFTIRVGPR